MRLVCASRARALGPSGPPDHLCYISWVPMRHEGTRDLRNDLRVSLWDCEAHLETLRRRWRALVEASQPPGVPESSSWWLVAQKNGKTLGSEKALSRKGAVGLLTGNTQFKSSLQWASEPASSSRGGWGLDRSTKGSRACTVWGLIPPHFAAGLLALAAFLGAAFFAAGFFLGAEGFFAAV